MSLLAVRMSASGLKSCALAVFIISAFKHISINAACPTPWVTSGGRCYLYVKQPVAFMDAVGFCANAGADLLEISSDTEQSFVASFIRRNNGGNVWLGITDVVQEGRWMSINTNNPISYTRWIKGQPDNHQGREGCGLLIQDHWGDVPCSERRDFICETFDAD